ncbi:MAG: hypothetical protein HY460_02470 [Parcubacteria group bacterium]|nr:hypothetical protein [Parcubacteria group bacterium]
MEGSPTVRMHIPTNREILESLAYFTFIGSLAIFGVFVEGRYDLHNLLWYLGERIFAPSTLLLIVCLLGISAIAFRFVNRAYTRTNDPSGMRYVQKFLFSTFLWAVISGFVNLHFL